MKSLRIEGCLTFLAALALAGCGQDEEVVYENPPVGVLVSSEHQITIHSGPDGPLYSVVGPGGKRLAREITKEELQASFPDLNVSEIWAEVPVNIQRKSPEHPLIMEPMPVEPLTAPR